MEAIKSTVNYGKPNIQKSNAQQNQNPVVQNFKENHKKSSYNGVKAIGGGAVVGALFGGVGSYFNQKYLDGLKKINFKEIMRSAGIGAGTFALLAGAIYGIAKIFAMAFKKD